MVKGFSIFERMATAIRSFFVMLIFINTYLFTKFVFGIVVELFTRIQNPSVMKTLSFTFTVFTVFPYSPVDLHYYGILAM